MKTEVLIAGAGPVGLTMAAELVRYGVSVRIVEKAATRTDKSKALVVWSRTLELLDRAGCSEVFLRNGLKVRGASIIADGEPIGHVSMEGNDTPYPFALMIPQSETERLLETQLEALGVHVERQVELISFEDGANGVTSIVRHKDGSSETIESDWLAGCDGAHSTVRHALGMPFEGNTLATDFLLADLHVSGFAAADTEISTFWHEEGVLVFFPISKGRCRVIADVGASTGSKRPDPTLSDVQAIVDRRGPAGIVLSDPVWLANFAINERKVSEYHSGRVFLAGDAAHIHSPAGGQGMNTGMQDAFNLAWKLALVCRGISTSTALLHSYSMERSAVGDKVLADAGRLTKLAMIRSRPLQFLRNFIAHHVLGLGAVQRTMTETLSELAIAYAHSPLTAPSTGHLAGPAPGARMAPVPGQPAFGGGDTPRFAILATGDDGFAALAARHAELLEPVLRPAMDTNGIFLVRPDGYLAMTCAAGRWNEVGDYLDRIAGRN